MTFVTRMPDIRKVGVLGAGLMGSGIAEVCAKAGFDVVVREPSEELLAKGRKRIENSLLKAIERGKMDSAAGDEIRARLLFSSSLEELSSSDLVIEAIVENLEAKREVYRALDALCGPGAIFCSNTSSLTIAEMAAGTKRPDRFAGLHFFRRRKVGVGYGSCRNKLTPVLRSEIHVIILCLAESNRGSGQRQKDQQYRLVFHSF